MINVKKLITEERNESVEYGCLMALFPKDISEKIVKFGKRIIKDEDLYKEGNEFGREKEGHVTIRYGFTKDLTEVEIRRLLKGQKQFVVELYGIGKFEGQPNNTEAKPQPYDVIYFKAKSDVLTKLNEETKQFPHVETYGGIYRAHATIAYVQRGTFDATVEDGSFTIPVTIKTVYYSPVVGEKSYFELEK